MRQYLQRAYILGPIIIFVVLIIMMIQIDQGNVAKLYQQENQVEDVIRRYAIACYAQEGAYPVDLEYLEDNYGLIINEEKYDYYYDLFASNILPDIKVITKNGR